MSSRAADTRQKHRSAPSSPLSHPTPCACYDLQIPGSRATIDHLAVTPGGVWVVDAKRYRGRPRLKVEGGVLRARTEKLMVGGRDRSTLVDGVIKQVDLVQRILGADVPVNGVLCFIDAEWPLIGGDFITRGVEVMRPKKLCRRLLAHGPWDQEVDNLHRCLAQALPPA